MHNTYVMYMHSFHVRNFSPSKFEYKYELFNLLTAHNFLPYRNHKNKKEQEFTAQVYKSGAQAKSSDFIHLASLQSQFPQPWRLPTVIYYYLL